MVPEVIKKPPAKPRRRAPRMQKTHDVDLTGGFRLDLKTGLLLLGLLGSWYDQRSQAAKREAVAQVQAQSVSDTLGELKRLQAVQQYDLNAIKLTLAENGIKVKKVD